MSWLSTDFGKNLEDFGAVVPETAWQLDEFPESSPKRQRLAKYLSFRRAIECGSGTVLGRIIGLSEATRSKLALYLKDEHDSVACVVPATCGARIGDLVSIEVVDIRPLETAPQVNQTICSLQKVLVGSNLIIRTWELDEIARIVTFPWEIAGPSFEPLDSIRSPFPRLKLTVSRMTKSDRDDTLQLLCQDSVGSNATLKLDGGRVDLDLIRTNTVLILSGGAVSRFGDLYNVFMKRHTLLEIESNGPGVVQVSSELPTDIRSATVQMETVPDGCEDTVEVIGHITHLGVGLAKVISAAIEEGWSRSCAVCKTFNPELPKWKLRFGFPLALTDETGTIRGLYLNDPLATDFLGLPPETYIDLDQSQIDATRTLLMFTRVRLYVHVNPTRITHIERI
ncbi:hypothetical protein PSACC_03524 [Paramicrosporidium saccamoebae]|uniref:Uncharacterized protein n=1 Tax=Paramicrosporidium saccamoebae TaxID=1246581 RepID=A0A2H9TFV2_9FUNG|nr:hypothetical protein PSACC_03524 [Paramicrosporidium saccamoebae]